MITVKRLIDIYNLEAHPEGGFYREMYRDEGVIQEESLPAKVKGERNYSTFIYFLLPPGHISKFHKIKSDEIWHFYLGGPLQIVEIDLEGKLIQTVLGNDILKGHKLHHVVPAGHWFGARLMPETGFSLAGCTVSPGFDFEDFKIGDREKLINNFPRHEDTILVMT